MSAAYGKHDIDHLHHENAELLALLRDRALPLIEHFCPEHSACRDIRAAIAKAEGVS